MSCSDNFPSFQNFLYAKSGLPTQRIPTHSDSFVGAIDFDVIAVKGKFSKSNNSKLTEECSVSLRSFKKKFIKQFV